MPYAPLDWSDLKLAANILFKWSKGNSMKANPGYHVLWSDNIGKLWKKKKNK